MRTPILDIDGIGHALRTADELRRYTTRTRQDWRDILGGRPFSPPGMEVGMVNGPLLVCEAAGLRLHFACPLPGGDGRRYYLELSPCLRQAHAWDYAPSGKPKFLGTLDRIGVESMRGEA